MLVKAMDPIDIAVQRIRGQRPAVANATEASAPADSAVDALWSRLRPARLDPARLADRRIVTFRQADTARTAFDMVRTKVLQYLRENSFSSIAVTSPTAGCGKTAVALNLAFSLANQPNIRTVLLDLDLRRPSVARELELTRAPSMEAFLKGDVDLEEMFVRYGDNLAVAANSKAVPLAAELLQSASAAEALRDVRSRLDPDVLVVDLPPMLVNDDVMAFLPCVDCVLLVAEAEASTPAEVELCEQELSERAELCGVVLNKCRYTDRRYGY